MQDLKVNIKVKTDAQKIKEFDRDLRSLDKQYKDIQKSGKEYSSSLDGLNRKHSIISRQLQINKDKLASQKAEFKRLSGEIKSTKDALEKLNKAEVKNVSEIAKKERSLERLEKSYASTKRAIDETVSSISRLEEQGKNLSINISGINKLKGLGENLQNTGDKLKSFGSSMLGVGIPIMLGTKKIVDSAISFESAFAGVRKTTDATEKEYKKLADGILDLSTKMPQSADAIAKVAEISGQLGISKNSLLDFTKTMIMLGDSTNLSAEEGATAIAQFKNVVKMSDEDVSRFGSSLVELGNNFATTERDIMNLASRMSGTGAIVGMSSADILGFATALSSVGVEAEMGGSSFSKLLTKMQLATAKGGRSLEDFARIANVSTNDFRKAFKENATQGVLMFIDGLAKIKASGGDVTKVLSDMGFSELRLTETIKKMIGASGSMHKALDTSNKAWRDNNALVNEASKRYATSESKLAMAKNELKKSAILLGNELLPQITELLKSGTSVIRWFNNLSPTVKKAIINFGLFSTVLGGTSHVFGSVANGLGSIAKGGASAIKFFSNFGSKVSSFSVASGNSAGTIAKLGSSIASLGPIGLGVTAGVVALGGAIYTLNRNAQLSKKNVLELAKSESFLDDALLTLRGQTKYTNEELVKMGYIHKELNGVSKSTRDSIDKTSQAFKQLSLSFELNKNKKIFDENQIKNQFTMVDNIVGNALNNINNKIDENKNKFAKLFTADGNLSKDEQEALNIIDENAKTTRNKIEKLYGEIKAIRDNSLKNHKALSDAEVEQVRSKVKEIAKLELESKGLTHKELIQAQEEFKAKMENLSLEEVSKELQIKRKGVEQKRLEIESMYNTEIALAQEHLTTLTGKEREIQESKIQVLREGKEKALHEVDNTYVNMINLMKQKHPEMLKEINTQTGALISLEDKACRDSLNKYIQTNNFKVVNANGTYSKLTAITKSGLYNIYNETDKTYTMMHIKVDDVTKKIVGLWNYGDNEIRGSTKREESSLYSLQTNYTRTSQTIAHALYTLTQDNNRFSANSVRASNLVQSALQNVKASADGTKRGIIELNGTRINVIVNKDGTIRNINSIANALHRLPRSISTEYYINRYDRTFFSNHYTGNTKPRMVAYFKGTNYSDEGLAEINEKGWELFDTKRARYKTGGLAYLGRGTKVTNHLASVNMMKEDIQKEVSRRMSMVDFSLPKFNKSEPTFNINLIIDAIKEGFKNARLEPQINLSTGITDRSINNTLGLLNIREGAFK